MSTPDRPDGPGPATRADHCVVALAECFRGDGELLANPIGTLPMIAGRLARASFEPDLVMTDGEARLVAGPVPVGVEAPEVIVEAWNPYRTMFDVVWSGRRHVVMGASQLDPFGNHNFAFIGDWRRPRAQLLGFRGAPGNTVNHATTYWVPDHSPRVFVPTVDVVCGVGTDRARALGRSGRFFELRAVVTNLGVLDVGGPDGRLRLRAVHPGVTPADVQAATGFPLPVADDLTETRPPSAAERVLLARIDPLGLREREVPAP